MTLRVLEAFSGVGSQRMALRNLGINHEVVAVAEIDKFAIASYEAIHGETFNLGDVSQVEIEDIPDHDLFTYSFPCQDISVAGNGLGLDEGSGTRSGLLWECQKIIAGKKPKYLLLENVKNLVGKKHRPNFDKWLEWLEEQGYTNYWQVLNAKNYGVPQNRERVFVVSVLGDHEPYKFPEPVELESRLKDVLENEVDEKFYLSEEKVDKLIINSDKLSIGYIPRKNGTQHQSNTIYKTEAESPSMQARDYKDPVKVLIKNATKKGYLEATHGDGVDLAYPESKTRRGRVQGGLSQTLDTGDSKGVVIAASRGRNPKNPSDRTVGVPTEQRLEVNKQGTSNTITTVQKDNYVLEGVDVHPFSKKLEFRGYKQKEVSPCLLATDYKAPKTILESRLTAQEGNCAVEQVRRLAETARPNTEIGVTLRPNGDIRPHRMDVKKSGIQELNINHEDNPSHTVTTTHMPKVYGGITDFRIRKLTPLECWRLMGFSDEDFHKAEAVNSNSQLYKQAGNSIVVPVLEAIFKQLFKEAHT